MVVNDQTIIDNTHFRDEDGKLVCYTNLPGGEQFAQAVSSQESVQKNMIGWCNTVRDYLKQLEVQAEEERLAAKAKRVPEEETIAATPITDARQAVMQHYDSIQAQIDQLGEEIAEKKEQRNALRKERDDLHPIIVVWRGE